MTIDTSEFFPAVITDFIHDNERTKKKKLIARKDGQEDSIDIYITAPAIRIAQVINGQLNCLFLKTTDNKYLSL